MSAPDPSAPELSRKAWPLFGLIIALGIVLFAIRLLAPPNLLDQDQERPASYVLDAVKNGHWVCQRDLTGDISSKPPLYTWLAALATLACGRITIFSLYLPGAIAAIGTATFVLAFGRKYFGTPAALFGALAAMLSPAGLKEFGLARTDGVFAFTVTAAALLAFQAWQSGRHWLWFWLLAALATLTKGPLGIVLASAGLLSAGWPSNPSGAGVPPANAGVSPAKSTSFSPRLRAHLPGIALLLLLTAGWFLLAYLQFGQPLIAKMLGKELLGHAITSGKHAWPGSHFYQPPLYYLGRAAPWSLLAYYGLWRVWKHPSAELPERRFERFLFCWFVAGLLLFSLAPHQRADLLWPLMPAGALLAGRELVRLLSRWKPATLPFVAAALVAIGLTAAGWYYFSFQARQPVVRQTVALKNLARAREKRGTGDLVFVDAPVALQVFLNTYQPPVSPSKAAELLRGSQPVLIAVKDLARIDAARAPNDPPYHQLLPESEDKVCPARIISNISH